MAYKYEKQKWVSYDIEKNKSEQPNSVVTANKLNHMEEGIELANSIQYNITTSKVNINSAGVLCNYDETTKTNNININIPEIQVDDISSANLDTIVRSSNYLSNLSGSFSNAVENINSLSGTYNSSLKERLKSIFDAVGDSTKEYYGCRWYGEENEGKRTGKAAELTVNIGTNNNYTYNDFDFIYPWSDIKRVYCTIKNNKFEFLEYASDYNKNQLLCVEIPKFYYKIEKTEEYTEIKISKYRLDEEYQVPSKFKNKNGQYLDYVYIPAYKLNYLYDEDDFYFTFKKDILPFTVNSSDYSKEFKSLSNMYTLLEEDNQIINLLARVEFGVLNLSTIMKGAVKTHYDKIVYNNTDEDITIIPEYSIIQIKLESIDSVYLFNDTLRHLAIVKPNSSDLIFNVEKVFLPIINATYKDNILSIEYDDLIPIEWENYYIVIETPYMNGVTNYIKTPSGSLINNTSGYYPCRYRYIENPWGNIMDFINEDIVCGSCIYDSSLLLLDRDLNSYISLSDYYGNLTEEGMILLSLCIGSRMSYKE